MAGAIWKTYAVNPLGFGGVATFLTWVIQGDEPILEVAAFVDTVQVLDPIVLAETTVKVVLDLEENNSIYVEGLPSPVCVVSWFTRTATGWKPGPVRTGIDTAPNWDAAFPYPKIWVVDMLQQLERETQPLGADKVLAIRSAYPRDQFPLPCISVNFEAAPIGPQLVGDVAANLGPQRIKEGKGWAITISVILWSDTPEERDSLVPWLGRVSQALVHLAPYQQITEPNYNITENEDFSGGKLEIPLFIAMSQITGTCWSRLDVPVRDPQGFFTV
jgi:hypothetical protein